MRGRERGRTIGFPTANLASETECIPPDGVYATRVILDDGAYPSITNIGMRPTFAEAPARSRPTSSTSTATSTASASSWNWSNESAPKEIRHPRSAQSQIAIDLSQAREILAAA